MKIEIGRIVAVLARSIRESGLLAILSILLCAGWAQGQQLPEAASPISPRVKAFIGERWNSNSFATGLRIVSDTNETPVSRTAALELLHANRRKLSPTEMGNLLSEAARTAKDPSLDETNSAFAVSIMANVALTMKDQGQISEATSKQEGGFLIATATDARRNVQLRASAIVALGTLRISEAELPLKELLTNSASKNVPEIVRPASLSLMRIEGERAIPDLASLLKETNDPRIYGTAAFALGHLKRRECVVALVENLNRFPNCGSCEAALVDMDTVVFDMLKSQNNGDLTAGIRATQYLWRDGQREVYVPLLRKLISSGPVEVRRAAMERLLESASCLDFEREKRELSLVSVASGNQPELEEYQERIRNRLSAGIVSPNSNHTGSAPSAIK